jgi:hypothetical protein
MDQAAELVKILGIGSREGDRKADVTKLYQRIFSRSPAKAEVEIAVAFLSKSGEGGWERYVQGLLSTNEFLFVL